MGHGMISVFIRSRAGQRVSDAVARGAAMRPWVVVLVAMVGAVSPQVGEAQPRSGWHEATPGSVLEEYLRTLQLAGRAPRHQLGVRGFTPKELDALIPSDTGHPWAGFTGGRATADDRVRVLRPGFAMFANSGAPRDRNDGALWVGRGMTASADAGVRLARGVFTAAFHPMVFWAQNASFPLAASDAEGLQRFGHGRYYRVIDLPQRFGDRPYYLVDPGQSFVRADLRGFAVGFSTENEIWGPASDLPLVLGANAAGIPRLFVGTSMPRNVWLGRIQGRAFWGRAGQTAYSAVPADSGERLVAGLVVSFSPRGLPGLEIGGTRFIHRVWPAGGPSLRHLNMQFATVVKGPGPDSLNFDNDLGSVFFRVAALGGEVYGELATDDLSYAAPAPIVIRELITEPDHVTAYMLGVRRAWDGGDERLTALRVEIMNNRVSHLARIRGESDMYIHTPIFQGHTHRGQLLGPPGGLGGEAIVATLDRYHPAGRWTATLFRFGSLTSDEAAGGRDAEVVVGASFGALHRRGPWEIGAIIRGDARVEGRSPLGGLQLSVAARYGLGPR
jgi:hypothetical protein